MQLTTRIFLLGFMGSGKSTLGPLLATKLGYKFLDTDSYIENYTDQTINELFESYGERHFRDIESICLKKIAQSERCIIACGGGLPCYNNNMEFINKYGLSIYIKCREDVLLTRLITDKNNRPLIKSLNYEGIENLIKELLPIREEFYSKSDMVVTDDNLWGELQILIDKIYNYPQKYIPKPS